MRNNKYDEPTFIGKAPLKIRNLVKKCTAIWLKNEKLREERRAKRKAQMELCL
jgi:hypothetical protein